MNSEQLPLVHVPNSYSYRSVKYWCFNCERQFSKLNVNENTEVHCPTCDCPSEEITGDNDPRLFRPFVAEQNQNRSSNSTSNPETQQPNQQSEHPHEHHHHHHHHPQMHPAFGAFLGSFPRQPRNGGVFVPIEIVFIEGDGNMGNMLDGLFGLLGAPRAGGRTMDQIIEEFLRNDPNRYGPPPASDTAISNLKKKKFTNVQESKACTVCQDDYNEQDELVEMPCGHEFHDACVINWLKLHNTCPVCRKAVEVEDVHEEANKEPVN
jgi:E3 ubiquitin-protein ligase RNF115/126